MKIEYFVDEMPRDCASCKHYHMNCADGYSCSKLRKEIHPNFSEGIGYRHQDCPLQSLTDYTKQVRKEVCEDVEKRIINYCRRQDKKPFQKSIEQIKVDLLTSINQIQGEANET